MIEIIIAIIAILFIAALVVLYILSLRTMVPVNRVDVVTHQGGYTIYSGDQTQTGSGKPRTVYYHIPSWVPKFGVIVKSMNLNMMTIEIKDYETFGKNSARFALDATIYCKIQNGFVAAQRFPNGRDAYDSEERFKIMLRDNIINIIRTATSSFDVEDVISKRAEIADNIRKEIAPDLEKWGCELMQAAIVDIKDPFKLDGNGKPIIDPNTKEPMLKTTVIRDISAKKEAEINSLSRKQKSIQEKEAEVVEAENLEIKEKRKVQAQQQIDIAKQTAAQQVAAEQQKATEAEKVVTRTATIKQSEIDRDQAVIRADADAQANIKRADGDNQANALRGQGEAKNVELVGIAKALVIQKTKEAEAAGLAALAAAQAKQQQEAIAIKQLDVTQAVAIAQAEALKNSQVKFIGSGTPKNFWDMFSPEGGISTGAAVGALKESAEMVSPGVGKDIGNIVKQAMDAVLPKNDTPSDVPSSAPTAVPTAAQPAPAASKPTVSKYDAPTGDKKRSP